MIRYQLTAAGHQPEEVCGYFRLLKLDL